MMAPARLTLQQALLEGTRRLARAGCEQARLDAEILLADLLGVSRAYLLARLERPLNATEVRAWDARLARRERREPTAYILGHREFYGLDFLVDGRVLVPRPESELLVERTLALAARRPVASLWDVGTGSGALALTLARVLPRARVVASDVSVEALAVAALNRRRLGLEGRVALVQCELLEAAKGPVDVVVANPPYLSPGEYREAMPEVSRHEPRLALEGGATGLEVVARLLAQAARLEPPPALVVVEIGAGQGPQALALARRHFPGRSVTLQRDLAGWDRVLEIGEEVPVACAPGFQAAMGACAPFPGCAAAQGEAKVDGGGPCPGTARVLPAEDPASMATAARALREGEIVAFPTDTVYGLGAAVFRPEAVQALYEVKGRPERKAIPLLLAHTEDLPQVVTVVPPAAQRLVRAFWPGPLTLVLEASGEVPAEARAGGHTVAVRVPDHPVARALIESVGAPLATTSANRSGEREAHTAAEVVEQLGDRVRWVVDGGRSPGGTPSTVVDLTVDPPAIRRLGAIAAETIRSCLSRA